MIEGGAGRYFIAGHYHHHTQTGAGYSRTAPTPPSQQNAWITLHHQWKFQLNAIVPVSTAGHIGHKGFSDHSSSSPLER